MQTNGPVSTLLTWKPLSQALWGCSCSPTSPGEGARTYHPSTILGWHRSPQGKSAHDWPSVLERKDAAHTGAHIPVPTPHLRRPTIPKAHYRYYQNSYYH